MKNSAFWAAKRPLKGAWRKNYYFFIPIFPSNTFLFPKHMTEAQQLKCIDHTLGSKKTLQLGLLCKNGNFRWKLVGENVHRESCSKHQSIRKKGFEWVLLIANIIFLSILNQDLICNLIDVNSLTFIIFFIFYLI